MPECAVAQTDVKGDWERETSVGRAEEGQLQKPLVLLTSRSGFKEGVNWSKDFPWVVCFGNA